MEEAVEDAVEQERAGQEAMEHQRASGGRNKGLWRQLTL
jgi:hypothetical protein